MADITTHLPDILARLSALFPPDEVKSFPLSVTKDKSKGMAAFYIDARAVQQRLDDTCYWQVKFQPDPRGGGKSVMAGISVLVDLGGGKLEWVTRWDGADNSDIEATKGGLSGAVRRAAVTWGVGRYLYKVPGQWLPMKPGGRYFAQEPQLPSKFVPGKAPKGDILIHDHSAPPATSDLPALLASIAGAGNKDQAVALASSAGQLSPADDALVKTAVSIMSAPSKEAWLEAAKSNPRHRARYNKLIAIEPAFKGD